MEISINAVTYSRDNQCQCCVTSQVEQNESIECATAVCRRECVIIIIIIKKVRQCKAEREWYTPYQSEDQSPTIPTYRQKEEKGKKSRRL